MAQAELPILHEYAPLFNITLLPKISMFQIYGITYNTSPLNFIVNKLVDIHFILEYEKTVGVTQAIYSH